LARHIATYDAVIIRPGLIDAFLIDTASVLSRVKTRLPLFGAFDNLVDVIQRASATSSQEYVWKQFLHGIIPKAEIDWSSINYPFIIPRTYLRCAILEDQLSICH
jgi:hypothetical protein